MDFGLGSPHRVVPEEAVFLLCQLQRSLSELALQATSLLCFGMRIGVKNPPELSEGFLASASIKEEVSQT